MTATQDPRTFTDRLADWFTTFTATALAMLLVGFLATKYVEARLQLAADEYRERLSQRK